MAGAPKNRGRMGVRDEEHGEQERAGESRGEHEAPNTVDMEPSKRAIGGGSYGNTGDTLDARGSLGNTRQESYNEHRAGGAKSGSGMMGREESNFYNDLGKGGDGEGDSGSGTGAARSIKGFGGGKNTFGERSNFYNEVGEGNESDAECNSGSGLINPASSGKAKTIRGFTADAGLINGKV